VRRVIWKVLAVLAVGVIPGFFLTACASIMQGTSQPIGISSSPTGAEVTVSGVSLGETPLVADLKRKDHHIVRIQLDGYEAYETTLSRGVSGWVVGNILFGGLIGLAVDAISGGMYKLTPEQISANLSRASVDSSEEDLLFIQVVLSPDPSWERIGQLQREQ
jgi:hypothetical protein